MFEKLGFEELTPITASVVLGLVLGCAYGALAQRSAPLPAPRPGRTVERLSAGAGRLGDGTGVCDCRNPAGRCHRPDLLRGAPISRVRRARSLPRCWAARYSAPEWC